MKHIRFEYNPSGLFTVSRIATKKVNLKEGDIIKIHGVSPKIDDVYSVGMIPSPVLTPCDNCPFRYDYTDSDGFQDWGCRLNKEMNGVHVYFCMAESDDAVYTFTRVSDIMEDI